MGNPGFPVGHCLARHMELICQLFLVDSFFQAEPFDCGVYFVHINHLGNIMDCKRYKGKQRNVASCIFGKKEDRAETLSSG